MTVRFFSRSLVLPALLPLALAACVNAEPAIANPPAAPPLGVDLGGAPARRSGAVELAAASPAAMPAMNHAGHGRRRSGEIQMVHEGHADAHGTGTVTAVNAAQHRVGLQHEPIPAIGWPAMSMEFAVAPSVNLQAIQPGSRVNFSIEKGRGRHVRDPVDPAGGGRPMTPLVSRRRFVQGIAAAGALAALPWPLRGLAASSPAPVLSGTSFDLAIGATGPSISPGSRAWRSPSMVRCRRRSCAGAKAIR